MALVGGGNMSPQMIIQMVQVPLIQIREAMNAAASLNGWASGVSLEDLMTPQPDGPGMSRDDAEAVLSACADAWGHAQLWLTGTDPRNVPANYDYGASQRRVIGPRLR